MFRFFSGSANPYPLALFRVALYSGIMLHFWPSLFFLSENYKPTAFREQQWSRGLFDLLPLLPDWAPYGIAAVFMAACLCGLLGLLPRTAAILTFAGTYTFASFNSIHLQTLALSSIWAALPILAISGSGSEALSVRNLISRDQPGRAKQWAAAVLLLQLLIGFFFAGVEKLLAGWPFTNEMYLFLNYPQGFMVRDWIFAVPILQTVTAGYVLSLATVAIELCIAPFLLWQRTRWIALFVFQAFFIGVVAALEVPPLFWFVYASGAILVINDADIAALRSRLGRQAPESTPQESHATHL